MSQTKRSRSNQSRLFQGEYKSDLSLLASELKKKLDLLQPPTEITNIKTACDDLNIDYKDTCADGVCPQKVLPESLDKRIEQLAFRPNLQVPQTYSDAITDMATAISGYYDIILVSAFSSNHYKEAQILLEYIERTRQLGLQQRYGPLGAPNPYHTLTQMFGYFGDSPCAHMAFPQVETGFGIYHKEPLVQHAILDPWYACAVRAACICPVEQRSVQICGRFKGSKKIGLCMRNEQSGISIILAKLFREKYRAIVVRADSFQKAMREHKYPYFDELRNMSKLGYS
ncbi:hypothetical protein ElyMa_005603500 [Elysia marginata]|uniref:Uncharacterized protein n=1 Tax=Elysia marginata TaxID=1093978 RepID=A0AAV4F4G5_9GAST|nr:hypothetical protein ElyMa_005603500 [Elysia marginata]